MYGQFSSRFPEPQPQPHMHSSKHEWLTFLGPLVFFLLFSPSIIYNLDIVDPPKQSKLKECIVDMTTLHL